MKKFALIGAAGYVSPRHMKAIKETGNELVAAVDKNDSVGIIDKYFPNASFFTEIERFERHLELLKRNGESVDFVSICTPNYLHDAHCRLGLRVGANVICEKPLVINPWNIEQLESIESEYPGNIYTVLQLRLHPELIKIKKQIKKDKFYNVKLKYITPRGKWYHISWKGDEEKSGGILMNIGVHLFDLLLWLFNFKLQSYKISSLEKDKAEGSLYFDNAFVEWSLSLRKDEADNGRPHREMNINGEEVRFDNVFEDLHTTVYKEIIEGNGFRINSFKEVVNLIYNMRTNK